MQKFTQEKFQGLYRLLKLDNKNITCYSMNNRMGDIKVKQGSSLITISINGRVSVEQRGNLVEHGRYYGKNFMKEVKDIINYYKKS